MLDQHDGRSVPAAGARIKRTISCLSLGAMPAMGSSSRSRRGRAPGHALVRRASACRRTGSLTGDRAPEPRCRSSIASWTLAAVASRFRRARPYRTSRSVFDFKVGTSSDRNIFPDAQAFKQREVLKRSRHPETGQSLGRDSRERVRQRTGFGRHSAYKLRQ